MFVYMISWFEGRRVMKWMDMQGSGREKGGSEGEGGNEVEVGSE
jgi:hypothetical protein